MVIVWLAACGGSSSTKPDAGGAADAAIDAAPDGGGPPGLSLDPAFGDGGLAAIGIGHAADVAGAAALDADGKLVIAGGTQLAPDTLAQLAGELVVARLNADGTLDTAFGAGGFAIVPVGTRATGAAIAVQADGKLVVAGEAWFSLAAPQPFVVRLLATGALDATFGTAGVQVFAASGTATSLVLDGTSVVVAGRVSDAGVPKLMVARLTSAGQLDTTFAADGVAETAIGTSAIARGVALGGGGTLVAAGSTGTGNTADLAVVRYLANGTLDPAFGGDGIVTTAIGTRGDEANAVVVDAMGRVAIAGVTGVAATDTAALVVRYEADGDLDPTFDGDGIVTFDVANRLDRFLALALAGDKLVCAGLVDRHRVVQLLATGAPDPAFNGGTPIDPDLGGFGQLVTAIAAADGTIYSIATEMNNPLDRGALLAARMSATGVRDDAYGTAGIAVAPSGASAEIATGVVVDPDGSVVAAGFGAGLSLRRAVLAKLLADGTPDPGFGTAGATRLAELATARGIARTASGALVVAGDLPSPTSSRYTVARYTAAGALDTTFGTAGVFSDPVVAGGNASPRALAQDAAGRLVVVGNAGTGSSFADAGAIRLTAEGALDPTFGGDGRVVLDLGSVFDELTDVAVAPDGKLVAVGAALTSLVVRLEDDGDLDPTFDGDGIAAPALAGVLLDRVAVQADGRIVVAGYRLSPSELVVARLGTDGALDTTFGTGGLVTYATGGATAAPLPFGSRPRGPALVLAGAAIHVAATVATGTDEAMLLLTLAATDGTLLGTTTAGGAGYWASFALATAPGGGVVIGGRGLAPARGTELGLARLVP